MPWHKLSTKLEHPATAKEAMQAAGLDYTVRLKSLTTTINRKQVEIPDHFATVKTDTGIILGFYLQQPTYRLASDLGVNYKTITRVYQRLRDAIYRVAELEGGRLKGEIELDEAYFGGRCKGERGRGAS